MLLLVCCSRVAWSRPADQHSTSSLGMPFLPMPDELRYYDAVISRLRQLIQEREPKVVGIEGVMQAGKTHLAGRLASDLGAALVEVDKCSFKNRDPNRF